jgi:hypothetical protein
MRTGVGRSSTARVRAYERCDVSKDVIVAVVVSAPVIVAALVNGNDTVGVIDAVSDDATNGWQRR